jgi:hypothetical protein
MHASLSHACTAQFAMHCCCCCCCCLHAQVEPRGRLSFHLALGHHWLCRKVAVWWQQQRRAPGLNLAMNGPTAEGASSSGVHSNTFLLYACLETEQTLRLSTPAIPANGLCYTELIESKPSTGAGS